MPLLEEAWVQAFSQDDEDYFTQAGALYRILPDDEKSRLVATIAGGLSQAEQSAQERMLSYLANADPDYEKRVRAALA